MTNKTIPVAQQNIFEAMFACVENQEKAKSMTVAEVVEYLDVNGWDDLLNFIDDPRIFQQPGDKATRKSVIEVCNAYPHYDYAESCSDYQAEAEAFLAQFNN